VLPRLVTAIEGLKTVDCRSKYRLLAVSQRDLVSFHSKLKNDGLRDGEKSGFPYLVRQTVEYKKGRASCRRLGFQNAVREFLRHLCLQISASPSYTNPCQSPYLHRLSTPTPNPKTTQYSVPKSPNNLLHTLLPLRTPSRLTLHNHPPAIPPFFLFNIYHATLIIIPRPLHIFQFNFSPRNSS
jgi:hypothetical protein